MIGWLPADPAQLRARVTESLELLTGELEQPPDRLEGAVSAFLALALVDSGREREAVSAALAGHLPRYQRSLGNYARELLASKWSSLPAPHARLIRTVAPVAFVGMVDTIERRAEIVERTKGRR